MVSTYEQWIKFFIGWVLFATLSWLWRYNMTWAIACMMTSQGNVSCITGPVWRESIGDRWRCNWSWQQVLWYPKCGNEVSLTINSIWTYSAMQFRKVILALGWRHSNLVIKTPATRLFFRRLFRANNNETLKLCISGPSRGGGGGGSPWWPVEFHHKKNHSVSQRCHQITINRWFYCITHYDMASFFFIPCSDISSDINIFDLWFVSSTQDCNYQEILCAMFTLVILQVIWDGLNPLSGGPVSIPKPTLGHHCT